MLLAGRLVTDKRGLFAFLLRQVSKVCGQDRPQTFGNPPAFNLTHKWDQTHMPSLWALRVS